jgi:uncharacterized Zn finger protein (UPF0148 family)
MTEAISEDGRGEGIVRTDMHCHDCGKTFYASIDFDIDGNHIIICPICGHQHCRVIENGVATSERWDSKWGDTIDRTERVWSHQSLKMETSSAAEYLRNKWISK